MSIKIPANVFVEVTALRVDLTAGRIILSVRKSVPGFSEINSDVVLEGATFARFAKINADLLTQLKAASMYWLATDSGELSREVKDALPAQASPDTSVVDAVVAASVDLAIAEERKRVKEAADAESATLVPIKK
jgi:hypothetical protein